MSYYFVIVGTIDNPVYEAHLTTSKSGVSSSVPPPNPDHPLGPSYSVFGPLTSHSAASISHLPADQLAGQIGYAGKSSERARHVMQLVAHASLDMVDEAMWAEKGMYLKNVDRFHEWTVSAWLPPGGMRFVLLHEIKNDDGIRSFFNDAWDAFVRTQMSPFYALNARIASPAFDAKIRQSARRYL